MENPTQSIRLCYTTADNLTPSKLVLAAKGLISLEKFLNKIIHQEVDPGVTVRFGINGVQQGSLLEDISCFFDIIETVTDPQKKALLDNMSLFIQVVLVGAIFYAPWKHENNNTDAPTLKIGNKNQINIDIKIQPNSDLEKSLINAVKDMSAPLLSGDAELKIENNKVLDSEQAKTLHASEEEKQETDVRSHFNEVVHIVKANKETSNYYGRIAGEEKPIKLSDSLLAEPFDPSKFDVRADFDVEYVVVDNQSYARTIILTKVYGE